MHGGASVRILVAISEFTLTYLTDRYGPYFLFFRCFCSIFGYHVTIAKNGQFYLPDNSY